VQKPGRDQPNRLRWITSGKFSCAILKKGNIFYLCLVNSKALLRDDKRFRDEAYQRMELKGQYTGSSKSNASSQSLGSNPTNYKISRTRRRTESANFIRLQLEYLHL
jgi:hypothetical protein